jgi:glutathione S-transferase
MLELYHHGTSVCAAKPRILLAEKGLEWTGHYIDILKGEQFAPEYLKLNPKGVVPTPVRTSRSLPPARQAQARRLPARHRDRRSRLSRARGFS